MMTPRRFQRDLRFFHLNSGLPETVWRTKSQPERWQLFCQALGDVQYKTDFTAHAFVLMGTHFHILFSTRSPKEHILAEEFYQNLKALCNSDTEVLEIPFYCEPILSLEYYKNAYKYLYRNPVTAGLCKNVEDYEFSSMRAILGYKPELSPVIDNMSLIYSPKKVLEWLNTPEIKPTSHLEY